MRNYFKKVFFSVVFIVFFGSNHALAGSYDDFFVAIKQDNLSLMNSLLQRGFDPDTRSPEGAPGLYLALREESLKTARLLMSWPKANIDARTAQDESPLMMAALKGYLDIARQLVARNADVNKTGWTPLHYAATNGHVDIMRLLLEHHAYIDAASPNRTTPLMMAALYGTTAAVTLLLDEGADPSLKNQQGLTALDFAQRGERPDAIKLLGAAMRGRPAPGAPATQAGPAARPMQVPQATPATPAAPLPPRPVGQW